MDLLMLPGWRAVGHEPAMDDSLIVQVELIAPKVPACTCEAPKVLKHGTRRVFFRDNPINRQAVKLRITRQRYRCREAMKGVNLDAIAVHMGHGIDLSTFERDAARAAFW
jgi:transposase